MHKTNLPRLKVIVAGVVLVAVGWVVWPVSGSERDEVEAAAVRLLTADGSVGRISADLAERKHQFETGADVRRATLADVWVPGVASYKAQESEEGFEFVLHESGYAAYIDNRYAITDLRSIRRFPGGYYVVFRGHMNYRDAKSREWGGSPAGTEHLAMIHLLGEWRLLSDLTTDYNPS